MSGRDLKRTWRVDGEAWTLDAHLEDEHLVGWLQGPDGDQGVEALVHRTGSEAVVVRVGGRAHRAVVFRDGPCLWVALGGHTWQLCAETPGRPGAPPSTEGLSTSPMTGTLTHVRVAAGQRVAEGAELFVVEAMKMEFSVKAPREVVVAEVRAEAGDKVQIDQPIVVFEDVV